MGQDGNLCTLHEESPASSATRQALNRDAVNFPPESESTHILHCTNLLRASIANMFIHIFTSWCRSEGDECGEPTAKVDKASVDASSFVESSSQWIRAR